MANIVTIREDEGNFLNPKTGEFKEKYRDFQIYNVSAPVVTGMANHFGDVVVVQALINVIYRSGSRQATVERDWGHEDFHPEFKGYKTPPVTGNSDMNTALAIKLFQIDTHSRPALKVDGVVYPLSFSGRNVKRLNRQRETISELNYAARDHFFDIPELLSPRNGSLDVLRFPVRQLSGDLCGSCLGVCIDRKIFTHPIKGPNVLGI